MDKVRWIDMIDPVYTLSGLAGIDSEENDILGIQILDYNMTIWYSDKNKAKRFVSVQYDLD